MNKVKCFVRHIACSAVQLKKMPERLKGRSQSSQHWLIRQLNDEYVLKAKMENYRARSAFKLLEIDDKHHILKPGSIVVECGAAPGAWTQVSVKRINATGAIAGKPKGLHIAIDLLPMYPVEGAIILAPLDFTQVSAQNKLTSHLGPQSSADVILSDMAPSASGMRELDHDSILQLAYSVVSYADQVSRCGASLLLKLWNGSGVTALENKLKLKYSTVKRLKPSSSRQESSEIFLLGIGYRKFT